MKIGKISSRSEMDTDKNFSWYIEKQVERTIKSLNSCNMEGDYVNNREQLF